MRQSVSDVEKLVAINEIREVMARYARHADHKEFEDLAGLFTPDGTFTPHKVDGSVWMHMEGRDGIATTISESVGNAQVLHQLFSYETEVLSPTSATSVVSMADMLIRPEGEAVASTRQHGFQDHARIRPLPRRLRQGRRALVHQDARSNASENGIHQITSIAPHPEGCHDNSNHARAVHRQRVRRSTR